KNRATLGRSCRPLDSVVKPSYSLWQQLFGHRTIRNAGSMAENGKSVVQSAAKVFAVLKAFDRNLPELTVTEIAARAQLDRGTAFRLVHTLMDLGYVRGVPDSKRYRLTLKCLELGFTALAGRDLPAHARPLLREVVPAVADAGSLGMLERGEVIYVERVQTVPERLGIDRRPGSRIGAYAAALGHAILDRVDELGRQVVERWDLARRTVGPDDDTIRADVERFSQEATRHVCRFLVTGEIPTDTAASAASAGWHVANRSSTLGDLMKVFLFWRDHLHMLINEEARRLDTEPRAVELAISAARAGTDSSLVLVAHRCDEFRELLQAQLEEEQSRLSHQALHDALTGLPNRVLFLERLAQSVEAAARRSIHSAVLFIDIDRFKSVNDIAGHAAGDQLLIGVARRLREVLRPADTVARLGGDEFVVLCENLYDVQKEAVAIAERICETVAEPFSAAGNELFTSASIGLAFVRPGDDPHVLVARADSAMYMAKQRGRSRWEIYHPDFDERTTRRAELINGLHRAVQHDELVLHYQPVKDLSSGAVVAMEALVRWQHPTLGIVAPTEFIPLAEETGLILEIGRWVLQEACTQCAAWRAEGFDNVDIAVNVSGRQLEDPEFPSDVERVLSMTGLPASALSMEVTESVIVTEGSVGHEVLEDLQLIGVRLAIDDFGIGYSSLSYLAKLPVHSLKVDRTFIAGLGTAHDASIVSAMVELAHKLGLEVVAEGVETEVELQQLRDAHCDEAQGFLLGRPAPLATLRESGALEEEREKGPAD
ncbi:MAG TPA: EAL domain-containing protein, partial [Acidimicrobiales bacterium]|nr:EAL domain-containing protein [Acidimicrobiales bacterium]